MNSGGQAKAAYWVGKALEREDVKAAVHRLGLSVEAGRMARWAELYGAKLGVTEVKAADPARPVSLACCGLVRDRETFSERSLYRGKGQRVGLLGLLWPGKVQKAGLFACFLPVNSRGPLTVPGARSQ